MSSTSRPPALRVAVTEVVSRTSLVTPVPPRGSGSEPPAVSVVQRAVRIISDPPPPPMLNSPSPLPASYGERNGIGSEPSITIESGTPPQGAGVDGRYPAGYGNYGGHPRDADAVDPTARHAYPHDRAQLPDEAHQNGGPEYADGEDDPFARSAYEPEPEASAAQDPFADEAALRGEHGQHQARGFEPESYASMEVEQLELSDDELPDDDEGESDGELESEIEVSMPPPAPPEALRTAPGERDEEDRRPSGEFEELEVDTDDRGDELGSRAAPPPPPVGRVSAPEPPDLAALARNARVQDLRPTRPRPHAWWEVFFDDDYLRTVRPPTREQIARQCDFIERRLALRSGATLLDVGCGLGLHVLELASRGYLGVGLDLSLPMLSRASEEAQSRALRVNFLHSDMREMSFDGSFDAVLCLGTTLGYFDEETNRRIIERLYRALKPGGLLLLDLVNRDHVIRSQPNLIWFEGDGCVCMEESEFNFFTSRLHVKRTVILDSGRQTENEYSLRMYSLHELGQLLNGIGFRVREVSGRDALPGVFFGQESPNLVIVAERRLQEGSEP
jgi:SAM-dependent methyltransferase